MLSRRVVVPFVAIVAQLVSCSSRATAPAKVPPPRISFVTPAAGALLHGVVTVTATAGGTGAISAFRFDAPASLSGVTASVDPATHSARLTADVDLSSFPDGPLTFTVTATDEFGSSASQDLAVSVAQRVPEISVAEPAASAMVAGVVTISATAAAQAGTTIASLELVDPPAGCAVDAQADAGALMIAWDTTRAPEGPTSLRFRAVDSSGLAADTAVRVTVDNTAFAQIEAFVSAGAPIPGALVEVYALDDATGRVAASVGSSGLLGAGGPTDATGRALVTLSAENYRGPVQLVAKPAAGATLSYLDPTPPARTVQLPASLTLSSILPSYATTLASVTAPITLWTTLADAELLAYAAGAHRGFPTRHTVGEAAAFGDVLFSAHFQAETPRWELRTVVPVLLTREAVPLGPGAYAAFPDVALAQLARTFAAAAKVADITAPDVVALLRQDLAADGQFDGKGAGGAQLETVGIPPVALDEDALRLRLANALDDFVRSGNNLSGLTRARLADAGVFTTISGDVSALFGARTPAPYDSEGPTLSIAAGYGAAGLLPVGATNLVNGVLRLAITASDPAGVQAIDLTRDGATMQGTFSQGAGTGTLVATYDTTGHLDGLVSFSITATDGRGNPRTTTYQVTIDNTGPRVTVVSPPGTTHYSAAIPLEATASDPSGVASCGETTRGAPDQDSVATRYVASWTPAAATADGAVPLAFRACDVVGNCTVLASRALRDTTPPAVTPGPAAGFTATDRVTITATATDAGAGVLGVFATSGTTTIAGTRSGATWTMPDVPLENGANSITVWATDRAAAANGDVLRGASVRVVRDTTPPAPRFMTGAVTYLDERGLTLRSADVPAQYQTTSTVKIDPIAADVYKVATRLGWPADVAMSPSLLEGANPYNIPFVQVAVPAGPSESPITGATYTITVGGVTATGSLATWRSGASTASEVIYDVPLSSNLAPELASTTASSFGVTVTATFTDAGGLTGTTRVPITFNVLGPPVFIEPDNAWTSLADVKGTHVYRRGNGSYHQLWDSSNANFTNGNVRLLRYVVSNPAPAPVALAATMIGGSWGMYERWDRLASSYARLDPTITTACNGASAPASGAFQNFVFDGVSITGCEVMLTVGTSTPWCWGTGEPIHLNGYGASSSYYGYYHLYHTCGSTSRSPATGPESQASWSSAAVETFQGGPATAGEIAPAQRLDGKVIVPAASGSTPGTLVLYVVRPVSAANAARQSALAWNPYSAANAYQRHVELFLRPNGYAGSAGSLLYYRNYWVYRAWASLALTREHLWGTVGISTQGISAGRTVGATIAQPGYTFSNRVISNH